MTHAEFRSIAEKYGFDRVYFTRPMKFELGANRFRLVSDPAAEFPFALSIAVLVRAYSPFTAGERIPAYYLASNRAYHAANGMTAELASLGVRAEKAAVPIKAQLLRSNIGVKCRNSLISIEPFGTRTVLLALAVDCLPPLEYDEGGEDCGDCMLCAESCPTGAIGADGLDVKRCMRLYMDTASHPDRVRDMQATYVGCEICQYACRRNAGLAAVSPSADEKAAFDTRRLIVGDTAEARRLVGKNMSGGGRLTAEAIAFAVRDGVYSDETARAADSPFDAVRDAVRYARERSKDGAPRPCVPPCAL